MQQRKFMCAALTPTARAVERAVRCAPAGDDPTRDEVVAFLENMVRNGTAPRADIERARHELARLTKGS